MKPKKIKIPATREEWLGIRIKGLGGSDAGAVLNLNKYKSAYSLWAEKRGLIQQAPDNEAMRLGRDLEDYVAKRFTQATGKRVKRTKFMYQHPDHPWMLANVDRLVVGEQAGLECKTMSQRNQSDLEGADIPPSYYAQCMHYLAVTGLKRWYICILRFQEAPYIYTVERDEEEIEALIKAEKEFWQRVESGVPPEVDGTKPTADALRAIYPQSDPREDVTLSTINFERYGEIDRMIRDLEAEKLKIENQIREELGSGERGNGDGWSVTWKTSRRKTLDSKKVKGKYPEIYAECVKETDTRPLVVKRRKTDADETARDH